MVKNCLYIFLFLSFIANAQTPEQIEEFQRKKQLEMQAFEKKKSDDLNKFISEQEEKKRRFIEKRNAEMQAFIKNEEDWNLITIGRKGNVNKTVIEEQKLPKKVESKKEDSVQEQMEKEAVKDQQPIKEDKFISETKIEAPDYTQTDNSKVIDSKKYLSPLPKDSYRTSSKFGYRIHPIYKTKRFHGGIDYAAAKGTDVFSISQGVVAHSGWSNSYGNFIIIKHEEELKSIYAHLDVLNVKKGQTIEQGFVIGEVGMTGSATGNHLHFEIVQNGKKVDPNSFIE